MNLASFLPWVQIGLSVMLIILVLLQQTDASMGAAFGASGGEGVARTRRGFERTIFQISIVVGILFVVSVLASILL
ncbi:MAG: preprotein translocase subunit SecG [Parcubacteria group bacterium RIFCSPHIGHO2_01_FULL_45_26]|nr:MAG: preprotein translocase subunit SecG [Parcubacteria group bacterium RIFCSPHIGHO2_01_FULL_45_26]